MPLSEDDCNNAQNDFMMLCLHCDDMDEDPVLQRLAEVRRERLALTLEYISTRSGSRNGACSSSSSGKRQRRA